MLFDKMMAISGTLPNSIGILSGVSFKGVAMATLIVGLTGLILGIFLGIAAKKFHVEIDEKEFMVRDLLPGNNCGGCGYAGCDGLAKAIANGEAPVNACPVANQEAYDNIGLVVGRDVEPSEKKVAFVKCSGTCDKVELKYEYFGIPDCRKLALVPGGGNKKCSFGCMGFGSCVKVCAFGAIQVVNGIAVVDKEKCTGCSKCVAECPSDIIDLVPKKAKHRVSCNSEDKGKDVKAACSAGCIGCKMCTKVCEYEAISVNNNLAVIDYNKCINCGKCAKVCPVKVIHVS